MRNEKKRMRKRMVERSKKRNLGESSFEDLSLFQALAMEKGSEEDERYSGKTGISICEMAMRIFLLIFLNSDLFQPARRNSKRGHFCKD